MRKFLTYLHSTIKLHWMLLAIFIYSAALVAGNLLIIQPQVREYAALKKQRGSLDEIYLKVIIKKPDQSGFRSVFRTNLFFCNCI